MFSGITYDGPEKGTLWSETDKVSHGYAPFYEKLAIELGACASVCELGVYAGGSLYFWQKLFPDGLIVGVDGNPDAIWPHGTSKIVSMQDDPELARRVAQISPEFDLIVDDCSHEGHLTKKSFEMLWPLVKPGGYYVIEDWLGTGPSMLAFAESFLYRLRTPSPSFDSVQYIRGTTDISALVAIHKAGLHGYCQHHPGCGYYHRLAKVVASGPKWRPGSGRCRHFDSGSIQE